MNCSQHDDSLKSLQTRIEQLEEEVRHLKRELASKAIARSAGAIGDQTLLDAWQDNYKDSDTRE